MKKVRLSALIIAVMAFAVPVMTWGAKPGEKKTDWVLDWEENFDGDKLDTSVWGRCTRGISDWDKNMSPREDLVQVRDGLLVLRGVTNPDRSEGQSSYLTGGVWSKGKKEFKPGRIEVRARLHGARGAWPAIWLLPFDTKTHKWPMGAKSTSWSASTTTP